MFGLFRAWKSAACVTAALMLAVTVAVAEDEVAPASPERPMAAADRPAAAGNPNLVRTHWMLDHSVVNQKGEKIGVVRDIVYDRDLNHVSYVVVQETPGTTLFSRDDTTAYETTGDANAREPAAADRTYGTARTEKSGCPLFSWMKPNGGCPLSTAFAGCPTCPCLTSGPCPLLGGGTKHAVALSALEVREGSRTIILPAGRARLASAPRITDGVWPFSKDTYPEGESVSAFWAPEAPAGTAYTVTDKGYTGYVGEDMFQGLKSSNLEMSKVGKSMDADTKEGLLNMSSTSISAADTSPGSEYFKYRKESTLLGMPIKKASDRWTIAYIDDLIVDKTTGKLAFADLGFGGFAGIGKQHAAVPFEAVDVRPQVASARLNADRDTLVAIANEQGDRPNLNDPRLAERTYARFNVAPDVNIYGYAEPGAAPAATNVWGPDSRYNKMFNARSVETINGTIESVGTFQPAGAAAGGTLLRVRTDDGKLIRVHLGPAKYIDKQGLDLKSGDRVRISGSRVKVNGADALMATEIHKGDKVLELRDSSGAPKWTMDDLK